MNVLKKLRLGAVLNGILVLAAGILLCWRPVDVSLMVSVAAGAVLILSGIPDIIRHFTQKDSLLSGGSLFTGVFKAVLGIFCITHADTVLTLVSAIFGVFIIVDGISNLEGSIRLAAAKCRGWWVNLLLAIAILAVGVGMLFRPIQTVETAVTWIGVILIVDGVIDFVMLFRLALAGKKVKESLKDAERKRTGDMIESTGEVKE